MKLRPPPSLSPPSRYDVLSVLPLQYVIGRAPLRHRCRRDDVALDALMYCRPPKKTLPVKIAVIARALGRWKVPALVSVARSQKQLGRVLPHVPRIISIVKLINRAKFVKWFKLGKLAHGVRIMRMGYHRLKLWRHNLLHGRRGERKKRDDADDADDADGQPRAGDADGASPRAPASPEPRPRRRSSDAWSARDSTPYEQHARRVEQSQSIRRIRGLAEEQLARHRDASEPKARRELEPTSRRRGQSAESGSRKMRRIEIHKETHHESRRFLEALDLAIPSC